jgi:hypothetical protein
MLTEGGGWPWFELESRMPTLFDFCPISGAEPGETAKPYWWYLGLRPL